jgi:hypothetical protein
LPELQVVLGAEQMPQLPPQPSLPHSFPLHAMNVHWFATHVWPQTLHEPHEPPHPLSPQVLPVQFGTQTHLPPAPQTLLAGHQPQEPPQASAPHCLPTHCGWQPSVAHRPLAQCLPAAHVPQLPPHPSSPHVLPAQFGVQHDTLKQTFGSWHPQS